MVLEIKKQNKTQNWCQISGLVRISWTQAVVLPMGSPPGHNEVIQLLSSQQT